jgi:hypothetical protein
MTNFVRSGSVALISVAESLDTGSAAERIHLIVYDASIPFNLSFTNFSFGLFDAPLSQSCTFAILTVCVTDGLRASTSIVLAEPGAQSCSRNTRTASTTAS